jgi:hypothetical protein
MGGASMHLTPIQDQAIAARVALTVGAATFDWLYLPAWGLMKWTGDILYVYAKDEETAAKIKDNFALHTSIIATDILKR